ncbi:MAG: LysR family transcriptional regulator [Gemmatimonadetes bacterium]|nr:LysR family transcriptional regulator [Gemmatimonadota bacterium]
MNYRHLHHFWSVAREGGVSRAARALHVSQPALSAQIRKLERELGQRLFTRSRHGMELTDAGRIVFRYADEIFSLGDELADAMRGAPGHGLLRLRVGIVDAFPKLLAHHLVAPALAAFADLRLELRTAPPERLLAALAVHELDLVLSDAPLPPGMDVRAYSHPLGDCAVAVMAAPALAAKLAPRFPQSLHGAPFLMPAPHTALRRALNPWLADRGLEPRVVAEIDDSAVLKVFGQRGLGAFAVPGAVRDEVARMYHARSLGELEGLRERYYAITPERRIRNPAVAAISEAARQGSLLQGLARAHGARERG